MMKLFKWRKVLGSVRARIFLWYLFLLFLFIGISSPLMLKFVYSNVEQRVSDDLEEDMELFKGILRNKAEVRAELNLTDEELPIPTTAADLVTYFNVYFSRRLPEDDTFFIGIIDQQFYRSSPEALPQELFPSSPLLQSLKQSTKEIIGRKSLPNSSVGDIIYRVKPIRHQNQILGHFIVAHTVAGERQEAIESLQIVFSVLVGVFLLSLIVTALVTGRVLAPLQTIFSTAKKVNETDLTQRIGVTTYGEIADVAQAFNSMMDRLEFAFKSQRQFINDAGHELRTPITIIQGHLELMDLKSLPTEERETIHLVLDELKRMNRLVNELLLLAKAERADFLKLETFDLENFLPDLFVKIQALAGETRDWEYQGTPQGAVIGDRQRLTQAVMNLAANAVQHTQEGDRITLGAEVRGNHLSLWIEDTGEGIEPSEQGRIFERFARVKYTQRRSEGSGLGLAIVKRIVEAHHGTIHLHSQPGKGSTFTIVLPVHPMSA